MILTRLWNFAQSITPTDVELVNETGRLTQDTFNRGLRITFGIAGAIGVIIVIYGGLKYILSGGNSQETTKAKNTIIDALIGLVIIITSYGIISFVATRILP